MTSSFIERSGFKGKFDDLPPLPYGEEIPDPDTIEDKWKVAVRGNFEIANMFAMEHMEKDAFIIKPTLTGAGDTSYPAYAEWFNWIPFEKVEDRTGTDMVKLFVHGLGILDVKDLKNDTGVEVFRKLVEAAPAAQGRFLHCQLSWSARRVDGELKGPYFNVYSASKSSLDKGPIAVPF